MRAKILKGAFTAACSAAAALAVFGCPVSEGSGEIVADAAQYSGSVYAENLEAGDVIGEGCVINGLNDYTVQGTSETVKNGKIVTAQTYTVVSNTSDSGLLLVLKSGADGDEGGAEVSKVAGSQQMDISYTYEPMYTVEIPSGVTLSDKDVTAKIETKDLTLKKGQKLVVKISEAQNGCTGSKFTVKTADGAAANYQVKRSGTAVALGDPVAEFEYNGADTGYSQELTFTSPEGVKYAGTYTDRLTFTVSVE